MCIPMAKLCRDPKTGKWRSRKVIPADVQAIFGKREDNPRWPRNLTEGEAKAAYYA